MKLTSFQSKILDAVVAGADPYYVGHKARPVSRALHALRLAGIIRFQDAPGGAGRHVPVEQ